MTLPIKPGLSLSRRDAIISVASAAGITACATQSEHSTSKHSQNSDTEIVAPHTLARFTVNIETWWRNLPLHARLDAAAKAGFTSAEMWSVGSNADRSASTLKYISGQTGVEIIHCTVSVPNLANASVADAYTAFERSLETIERLGARYATVVGHSNVDGQSQADMLSAYQDRLSEAASLFEAAGIIACIEPFNPYDHPDHFLYGSSDAVSICRAIDSPNVKINWDLFHMQRYEGNVVHHLRDGFDQCALVQIADSPGRHEPGTGEMNYAFILREAMALGFAGPIGLECFPHPASEPAALAQLSTLAAEMAT